MELITTVYLVEKPVYKLEIIMGLFLFSIN